MAEVNTRHNQKEQDLLREVLNVLTASLDPQHGITEILAIIQRYSGAHGTCLVIFEDPRILITYGDINEDNLPSLEILGMLRQNLSVGLHYEPGVLLEGRQITFQSCLIAPIQSTETSDALLWIDLSPTQSKGINGNNTQSLHAAINGLTVMCRMLKANAHHAKLERNQSEFISIVSHDLRSPLTSIKGFAGMLESGSVGDVNDQQIYFIQKILAGISQMTSLVDNIQDAGRYDPETGFYKMQRTHCDLTEMVSRIVTNHLVPAEKQALTLHTSIADNVPIINIDTHMIERAIINLVDNAIKYTPNGGQVEVGVRVENDHILVSVRDSGLGISPENQVNLFERRVRIARQEHKRIKGSGLGLFIVRSAARRHGGDAWIESEEGKGSTFYISIPLQGENLIVPGTASV